MKPQNVDDIYALSPMQRLMLVHALTTREPGILANQVCYEIRGDFDAILFGEAWEAVVARHAALRTCVLWEGLDNPVQVVRGRVEVPIRELDLRDLSSDKRGHRLVKIRREDAAAAFDLTKAPLMRCTLARLQDNRHAFIWNIHHLVVDQWSHGIIMEDLAASYAALRAGPAPDLPPAPGFRDYIAWIAAQEEGRAESYWRAELAGFQGQTLLAAGPRHDSSERCSTRRALSPAATAALKARAVLWRTTPATLMLAAVGLDLARRHGTPDVLFGLTVSGRPPDLPSAVQVVGSFVNNVPVRLQADARLAVADWVREIQRARVTAQGHEHASPADIREWADLPGALPLFDLLLLLNLTGPAEVEWPGFALDAVSSTLDAGYPLILAVGVEDGGFALNLVHDDGLETAEGLLDGWIACLEMLAAVDPHALVADLLPTPAAAQLEPPAELPTAEAPVPVPAFESPAHESARGAGRMASALLEIWRAVLGIDDVGLDDDFLKRGGTSLQAAQLFMRIERLVGRTLPLSTLLRARTVRTLLVELDEPVEQSGPLVEFRATGTRSPLVVIPGIGGNVVNYNAMAARLGPDQPFYALQSRGVNGAEEPLDSVEEIAEDFIAQLPGVEGNDLNLLGVCFGAAVAFEMAVRLQSRGRPIRSLALLDPAYLPRLERTASYPRLRFVKSRLVAYWQDYRTADWLGRWRLLTQKARRAKEMATEGILTETTRLELQLLRVEEANRQAVEKYHPGNFSGAARMFLTRDREILLESDPRLDWLENIHPEPAVVYVPGSDSGDVVSTENVAAFADRLGEWLGEISGAGP